MRYVLTFELLIVLRVDATAQRHFGGNSYGGAGLDLMSIKTSFESAIDRSEILGSAERRAGSSSDICTM